MFFQYTVSRTAGINDRLHLSVSITIYNYDTCSCKLLHCYDMVNQNGLWSDQFRKLSLNINKNWNHQLNVFYCATFIEWVYRYIQCSILAVFLQLHLGLGIFYSDAKWSDHLESYWCKKQTNKLKQKNKSPHIIFYTLYQVLPEH